MTYNVDGSAVYTDALEMKRAFDEKLESLCPGGKLSLNSENSAMDDTQNA
jgi:hypothetical protein